MDVDDVVEVRDSSSSRGDGCRRGRPRTADAFSRAALSHDRQRRFRAKRKAAAKEAREAEAARVAELDREIGGKRHTNYAVFENVQWIARVGSAPSASGARAPLAGVISNVTCRACNRWSAELYRWRIYIYIAEMQDEVMRNAYQKDCVGVKLNFDETPARFFCTATSSVVTDSLQVRCVSLHGLMGNLHTCAPTLTRPGSSKASDLYMALDMGSIRLDLLNLDSVLWKYILVAPDGARSNHVIARHIVKACAAYPRMIILYANCFAHVLSNATKWALGRSFPYGPLLRVSHLLQARPLKECAQLVASRVVGGSSNLLPAQKDLGRRLWSFFLERFYSVKGPFDMRVNDTLLQERIGRCRELWPRGLPDVGDEWFVPPGGSESAFVDTVLMLFRRTVATPVLSRWYSVESFCWYLLGARAFGVFAATLHDGVDVRYWPGDNPVTQLVDPVGYASQSRERLRRTTEFLGGSSYVTTIFAAALSSIPRWRFARQLSPASEADASCLRGVSRALEGFLEESNVILAGAHEVVEHLIQREDLHREIRISVYVAIARSALYMSEKNLPYTTVFWRIVRGELPPSALREVVENVSCCAESGTVRKIASALEGLPRVSRLVALNTLYDVLRSAALAYTARGGCDNVVAESAFSMLRSLGLKLPYRPMKVSTGARELVIRHARESQKAWFKQYVERAYGSLAAMRASRVKPPSKVNGFTAFCRAMCVSFDAGRSLWANLDAELKDAWAGIAADVNSVESAARRDRLAAVGHGEEVGPLGSTHRTVPVSTNELFGRLNSESSTLRERWSRKSVSAYKQSMDTTAPSAAVTAPDAQELRAVILPGEKCEDCTAARRGRMREIVSFYNVAAQAYVEFGGSEHGVILGISISGAVSYFDLLIHMKNPRRLLALPLEVTDWRDGEVDGLGRAPLTFQLTLPAMFDGRSFCLADFCMENGMPEGIWAWRKRVVVCHVNYGWLCSIGREAKFFPTKAEPPIARRQPRVSVNRSGSINLSEFHAMFGDFAAPAAATDSAAAPRGTDGSEATDLDGSTSHERDANSSMSSTGYASNGSLVRSSRRRQADSLVCGAVSTELRINRAEQALFTKEITDAIDTARYAVAVRIFQGVIVCFWKDGEKGRHREEFVRACRETNRMRGCMALTSSKSSTLAKHSLQGAVRRAVAWSQWHAAWVYSFQPTCDLPVAMKLPLRPLTPARPMAADCVDSSSENPSSGASEILQSDAASSSSIASTSLGSDFSG